MTVLPFLFDLEKCGGNLALPTFITEMQQNDPVPIILARLQQYVPFCTFKVFPIATESHVNEMIKGLTG